jgi:hypothetical protein
MSTYIGETITGLPYPVFYDPHYPILINNPPVSLITGSPGSGKTFSGLLIASHASALGKIGVILDPKGDFTALKKLEKAGYIGKINIWSVADLDGEVLEENVGMLDPTAFTPDTNQNTALTIDVIKSLIGDLTPKQITNLTPIIRDIVEGNSPSFLRVAQKLMSSRDDEIRSLGYSLDTLLQTKLAKLIVLNKRIQKKPLVLEEGFIVANLMGLSMPPDTKPSKEWSSAEKISIIIMGLLSQLILDMMGKKAKKIYKTLIIDEAWAIMATESGKSMIRATARLGRSLNLAVILITQSTKHLGVGENSDTNTMISVRFAFRNNDDKDNMTTCKYMRLPEDEGWEQIIRELETGECLMQDALFNTSIVHIMTNDKWQKMFNTNPIDDQEWYKTN